MKKIVSFLATMLMAVMTFSSVVMADDGDKTVTVRIEGISNNVFYDVIETDAETVGDLFTEMSELGKADISLVEGFYGLYVSAVDGEKEASFGGYDGWMYMVNSVVPSVGISEYELKNNDSVVLFYSDQYGVGFQYPQINTDDIENGKISITSMDTVYDENYTASVVENPVAGATFSWDGKKYVTDENGIATLDMSDVTNGEHSVEIEKTSENGIPMVLRFAPGTKVTVAIETATSESQDQSDTNPGSGDFSMALWVVVMSMAGMTLMIVYADLRKKTYEK